MRTFARVFSAKSFQLHLLAICGNCLENLFHCAPFASSYVVINTYFDYYKIAYKINL